MISLEQIRLLESKITRAIELIRVLKEENSTLRKGLESAQKRMKELETLVDGFKADHLGTVPVTTRFDFLGNVADLKWMAGRPKVGHEGANARDAGEDPGTHQLPQCAVGRHPRHTKLAHELVLGGHPRAWAPFAGADAGQHVRLDLLVERKRYGTQRRLRRVLSPGRAV